MKNIAALFAPILSAAALAAATSSASVAVAASDLGLEIFPNGAMTNLNANAWPAGWPEGWRRLNAEIIQGDASGGAVGNMLRVSGAGARVAFEIPIKENYGRLVLAMKMRVEGVERGKEGWNTGRMTMSFHDAAGEMVGQWPNVFGMIGTTEWQTCVREYPIPIGAAMLKISPCNLGASGVVEFRNISLKVSRLRASVMEDAPLPSGFEGDPFEMADAWRVKTESREKVCLNGLWRFVPAPTNGIPISADEVPADGVGWGWFRVPGIWPNSASEFEGAAQTVRLSPWLEERGALATFDQAWYKRDIEIPEGWRGSRVALDFTMLQTHARAFVDGKDAGEIWFPGGELELVGIEPGKHELALLVTARPISPDLESFSAPDRVERSKAVVKIKGITGDLYLCSSPAERRIEDVHVVTSVKEKTITFNAETTIASNAASAEKFVLRAEVRLRNIRDGFVKTFAFPPASPDTNGVFSVTAPWEDAALWDTHTPENLYEARLSIFAADTTLLDAYEPVAFGFREIEIRGRDFYLNGKKIHIRALHNASTQKAADFANKDSATELCRRMQEYGFNALISGNYDFVPGAVGYIDGLFEACDETGVLMAFTLPHFKDFDYRLDTPANAASYAALAKWLIRRARNHPSVVFYATSHNSTGYNGDQNPLKIDGVHEQAAPPDIWYMRNRRQARLAQDIAKRLDPTRPLYHHQSGNLGDMHTVNIYLNWAPRQERSDWVAHWAENGAKPLFFVEWGLPHISSWSSYRGPLFIWRSEAYQSLWTAEYAAQFHGDAAYDDSERAHRALYHEEKLWARQKPFRWTEIKWPLQGSARNYHEVQAYFADDNWRAFRARGVSAMLPWDQDDIWWRRETTHARENPAALADLKRPGIVPDRLRADGQYIYDNGPRHHFIPTALGKSFLRWNQPDLAFIAGPADAFTTKDHNYRPGETVRKSIAVVNDRRAERDILAAWRASDDFHRRPDSPEVFNPFAASTGRNWNESFGFNKHTIAPGETIFVPIEHQIPKDTPDGTVGKIEAVVESYDRQNDPNDTFSIHIIAPPKKIRLKKTIHLYDPKGETAALLDRLDVRYKETKTLALPARARDHENTLLIIGRGALDTLGTSAAPAADTASETTTETTTETALLPPLPAATLIFEQSSATLEKLGFRITEFGARQVFPRIPTHPALTGIKSEHLRDWRGAATHLPPYLENLPHSETNNPTWKWAGIDCTRVWRSGNNGSVASVLIEKPTTDGWRAIIDCAFDLQYGSLLEHNSTSGRLILCQLDVTARTTPDPAADRLVSNLLTYLGAHPSSPSSPPATQFLLARPGDAPPADYEKKLAAGLSVLCQGLDPATLEKWTPIPLKTVSTNGYFKRIEQLPPELLGLSNADWAWHGALDYEALPPEHALTPTLAILPHGKGRVVIWQTPPEKIDEQTKPYLRTTKRRAQWMLSQLKTNLGHIAAPPQWGQSLYLDTPIIDDNPYRYYRW